MTWRVMSSRYRYAFTPLVDFGDDDDEDNITLSEAFGEFSRIRSVVRDTNQMLRTIVPIDESSLSCGVCCHAFQDIDGDGGDDDYSDVTVVMVLVGSDNGCGGGDGGGRGDDGDGCGGDGGGDIGGGGGDASDIGGGCDGGGGDSGAAGEGDNEDEDCDDDLS